MRVEIGVTAFYRSRWMSRSGLAPEIAMEHPAGWPPIRLGGAARDWPATQAQGMKTQGMKTQGKEDQESRAAAGSN